MRFLTSFFPCRWLIPCYPRYMRRATSGQSVCVFHASGITEEAPIMAQSDTLIWSCSIKRLPPCLFSVLRDRLSFWYLFYFSLMLSYLFQGNHMYGQIPPEPAGRFMSVLQEGMVYRIRKFFCNPSKPAWRPVKSPYMIQFTRYTVVEQVFHLEETYPFCTYSLTPFLELPKPSSTPA